MECSAQARQRFRARGAAAAGFTTNILEDHIPAGRRGSQSPYGYQFYSPGAVSTVYRPPLVLSPSYAGAWCVTLAESFE